jgi:hypothetical protein
MRQLPPELWLHIFGALCHVPASLEIQDHKIIEAYSEDANGIILHNQISSRTQTKVALSTVCWSWRDLALPLLFKEILIKSGQHASKLATTLQGISYHNAVQGSHYPGCWIKRIEVLSDINYWDEEGHEALTVILKNASNLTVFSDAFCTVPSNLVSHGPLIKQLSNLCVSGSLRRLEWYCDTPATLELVLKGTPRLEVLILCRGHIVSRADHVITLPSLRILSIGPYVGLSRFACMNAPCLESVLLFRSIVTADCEDFLHWLTSCSNLRHLRVPSTDALASCIDVQYMPRLETMAIDFGQWRKFTRPIVGEFRHKNLRRIDLSNFAFTNSSLYWHNYHKDYHWSTTFGFMHSLLDKERLPSLETIGFYIPHSYHRADEFGEVVSSLSVFWRPWLDDCKKRGIKVEICLSAEDHLNGIWQPFGARIE